MLSFHTQERKSTLYRCVKVNTNGKWKYPSKAVQ